MRGTSKVYLGLAVWVVMSTGLTGPARAQTGVPAPVIPASGIATPAAAAPRSIWSSLGLSSASIHACLDKLCASTIGQMMNGMLTPMSTLTGGMVPTFCSPNANASSLANQAALTGGPAGPAGAQAAAAAAQADVAGAGARIAAIEYLATLDCHYWPDAEAALIGRLRGDRVECVRFAAAQALGTGCCCTKKTIEALHLVVDGGDKDGFPSETSDRVRAAAMAALERCLLRFTGDGPEPVPPESPEPPTPKPPEPPGSGASPFAPKVGQRPRGALGYYETTVQRRSLATVIGDARQSLSLAESREGMKRSPTTGHRSVFGALARASSPSPRVDRAASLAKLERDRATGPGLATTTSQPSAGTRADLDRSIDPSVTQAGEPDHRNGRPRASFVDIIRRSLGSSERSERDDPGRLQP